MNEQDIYTDQPDAGSAGTGLLLSGPQLPDTLYIIPVHNRPFFPGQVLGLFSASDEMLAFGVPALRIISVTFLFAVTTILCGYFASGLGNGVVNMIGAALRQLVVLVPCLWLLIRTMGIEKAWFAFWVSEVIACAYSLWATKKELRNKVK